MRSRIDGVVVVEDDATGSKSDETQCDRRNG